MEHLYNMSSVDFYITWFPYSVFGSFWLLYPLLGLLLNDVCQICHVVCPVDNDTELQCAPPQKKTKKTPRNPTTHPILHTMNRRSKMLVALKEGKNTDWGKANEDIGWRLSFELVFACNCNKLLLLYLPQLCRRNPAQFYCRKYIAKNQTCVRIVFICSVV